MKPSPLNVDRVLLTILNWYVWRPLGMPMIIAAATFFLIHIAIWVARAAR